MKKYFLMIMAMFAMTFCFTSCGSDSDDNGGNGGGQQGQTQATGVQEQGNKMYITIVTNAGGGITIKQTFNAYFNEERICNKGEVVEEYPNALLANAAYEEHKLEGKNPTINGNIVTFPFDEFEGLDKDTVKMTMEMLASSFNN